MYKNQLKVDHIPRSHTFIPRSIKLLEKTGNLFDLGLGKGFLDMAPKSQSIKKKLINWILSKLRMKRQTTDWQKITHLIKGFF